MVWIMICSNRRHWASVIRISSANETEPNTFFLLVVPTKGMGMRRATCGTGTGSNLEIQLSVSSSWGRPLHFWCQQLVIVAIVLTFPILSASSSNSWLFVAFPFFFLTYINFTNYINSSTKKHIIRHTQKTNLREYVQAGSQF